MSAVKDRAQSALAKQTPVWNGYHLIEPPNLLNQKSDSTLPTEVLELQLTEIVKIIPINTISDQEQL